MPNYGASRRRSLTGFSEAIGFTVVDRPIEPEDPFFDVNTMEDMAEAKRRLF